MDVEVRTQIIWHAKTGMLASAFQPRAFGDCASVYRGSDGRRGPGRQSGRLFREEVDLSTHQEKLKGTLMALRIGKANFANLSGTAYHQKCGKKCTCHCQVKVILYGITVVLKLFGSLWNFCFGLFRCHCRKSMN